MTQQNLGTDFKKEIERVEEYKFEPIKGYPMLHWKGKRPFESTQFYPAQLKETHGEEVDNWFNRIYWGDNLQVMSHLLKEFRGKINLIYIDPPFDSKADYKKKIKLKGGDKVRGDSSAFEEKQYTDIWTNDEYLQFLYERLILMRELLTENGNIVVHADSTKGHHIRCLLDEVFSPNRIRNEITWKYVKYQMGNIKQFVDNTDRLFWYSKGENWTYNLQFHQLDKPKQFLAKGWDKERGVIVNLRNEDGKTYKITITEEKIDDFWDLPFDIETIAKVDDELQNITLTKMPVDNTWLLPYIAAPSQERLGYPTQKPKILLERIVSALSNPNDIVFDCFMGSGTTQAAALKLGRRYIGADINLAAIQTTTKRLLSFAKELDKSTPNPKLTFDSGEKVMKTFYKGFQIYNVNHYDFFRNELEAKDLLLKALEIQPVENNSLYDGEKDGRMIKIMPVNRIATRADLNELITNFDQRAFEKQEKENPGKPVVYLTLVCMGHEPDLAAHLQNEMKPHKIDVEVVDILRDKSKLELKRDAEAEIVREKGKVVIKQFYPMNLLQKLSLDKQNVEDWKELVESVMIDFNYDGAVFEPKFVDIPEGNELVRGEYHIPEDAGTVHVKITDLLSESLELTIK